ncbi:MAG: 5'-nucleotidase C-terminal domain-containing protein [Bacteroidetes bacterium]|nr:5'-nucleotidase C-terminal domain-containing protein [Bacteroidota bacterium]
MSKFFYIFCVGASLMACSSHLAVNSTNNKQPISSEIRPDEKLSNEIKPYKDSLDKKMNEVIGKSETDFIVARPSSNLMNWVADAIFVNQTRNVRLSQPLICLLNTGGIRSSIGKGDVTLGDMYKIMPFENTLVWVELPISVIPEIETYLTKSGGEPIANCKLINGKLEINGIRQNVTHFWVLTSDYLMNGGDKMDFFNKKTNSNSTGKLLRDILIEELKNQGTMIENMELRVKG